MRKGKQKVLEKEGWKFGTVADFLNLSDEEATLIELKLELGDALRECRKSQCLTQVAFAKAISSSQSRVAKMEAGDPTVSIDLLIKSMLHLGATRHDIAKVISRRNTE